MRLALLLIALTTFGSGCAHRQLTNRDVAGIAVITAVIALPLIVGLATEASRPPALK